MNRWIPAFFAHPALPPGGQSGLQTSCWVLVLYLSVCFGTPAALAQSGRSFPPQAQRAQLQVTQAPEILLDGKPARLAPGARIRGANDMLVLSATLAGQSLVVNVLVEPSGLVKEVWILSPQEASQQPNKP